jgi:hypothetical protein
MGYRDQFEQLALQLNFHELIDQYADPAIENLPSLDDSFLKLEFLLTADIIEYAINLS